MSSFFSARVLLALTASLLITSVFVNGSGDGMPVANFCNSSMTTFSDTASFLPGQDVTITCSLPAASLTWASPQFNLDPLPLSKLGLTNDTRLDGAIVFTLTSVVTSPQQCITATATIANIQEAMQGLSLNCNDGANQATVTIDVIDPPDPVTELTLTQICNNIITNWTAPTDQPCPITGYNISTNVSGDVMPVAAEQRDYPLSINSNVCVQTLEIRVSAISDAGASNATSSSITVVCTPNNISVVNISDTSALLEWTHDMNVSGVVEYRAMSMQSQDDSVTIGTLVDVIMATVGVDNFTVNVTFVVTSLAAENDACFAIEKDLPAIKYENVVEPGSETGTVTFPFQHAVMEADLIVNIVSPSPVNESCDGTLSEMAVIVSCSDLTNNVAYTVTLRGTLSVEETLLPFTFSETLTPTSSTTPPPTTATPPPAETPTDSPVSESSVAAIVGGLIAAVLVVLAIIITVLIICYCCIKHKTRKESLGHKQEGDSSDGPIALVEKKSKDPNTGEVGPYDVAIDGQGREVQHKEAPTGDEYAVVEKPAAARRAAPSTPQFEAMTYQDPNTIQRQEAPTGDLYALPQSKGKETTESMPVYSEVNKQPDRVYADLALPKGGDSGVNRQQPPTQEVLYSQVQKM